MPWPLTGPRKKVSTNRDHGEKKDHSGFFSGFPENMGTFPEPGPPVVVAGCAVPTRGHGDRSPAPAWVRGPVRAENDRAMGFAGMARSYRKITRFQHVRVYGPLLQENHAFSRCSGACVAPSSPVPTEMPATCG